MSLASGLSTTFNPATGASDPDNAATPGRDLLYVSAITSSPSKGSASLNGSTHKVTYTAQTGVTGTYSFNYTLNDSQGCTATGTVRVTVNN